MSADRPTPVGRPEPVVRAEPVARTEHVGRSEPGGNLGGLISSLATDIQDLVRGEVRLARTEMEDKLNHVLIAAIWLIGGALVAFAGLVVLIEAAAAALALAIPVWAASLIVGLIIIAVGGAIARTGLGMINLKSLTPQKTADNIKADARVIKEHT